MLQISNLIYESNDLSGNGIIRVILCAHCVDPPQKVLWHSIECSPTLVQPWEAPLRVFLFPGSGSLRTDFFVPLGDWDRRGRRVKETKCGKLAF